MVIVSRPGRFSAPPTAARIANAISGMVITPGLSSAFSAAACLACPKNTIQI
jgi:hypothetical protein